LLNVSTVRKKRDIKKAIPPDFFGSILSPFFFFRLFLVAIFDQYSGISSIGQSGKVKVLEQFFLKNQRFLEFYSCAPEPKGYGVFTR
jgi:hypothetical protein